VGFVRDAVIPVPYSIPGLVQPPNHHSFPTRRSSDLGLIGCCVIGVVLYRFGNDGLNAVDKPGTVPALVLLGLLGTGTILGSRTRSEEHTSELQSRFDLVWRPLLEKKHLLLRRMADKV